MENDHHNRQPRRVTVLGAGYTGRHICAQATDRGISIHATSRAPTIHLSFLPASDRIEFDLNNPETWHNIRPGADVIWCFPAVPEEHVKAFAQQILTTMGQLVVLGSTSAYEIPGDSGAAAAPLLDESAPIDLERPRVRGEEYLRLHHHAIVLRVAGIYGPGRNVVDWIRRGKVGPSPRYVNLIHVEDVAGICLRALERGRSGDMYNVSDGHPRRWIDICEEARRRWGVIPKEMPAGMGANKRLSTAKLYTDLAYTVRHPDLFTALDSIECTRT